MDSQTKILLLNELNNLTLSMDIPFARLNDLHWLMRNVQINNSNHRNTEKVIKICKLLTKD